MYEAIILSICPECSSFPSMRCEHSGDQFTSATACVPRPFSPDPALLDTAVKFVTSLRFARAPIRVSMHVTQSTGHRRPTDVANLVFHIDRNLQRIRMRTDRAHYVGAHTSTQ